MIRHHRFHDFLWMITDMNNYKELIQALSKGERFKYIYFWGHTPKSKRAVDNSCFSQWYSSPFLMNDKKYYTAEHYMMVQKARLFGDDSVAEAMLNSSDPGKVKALGRQVKGFNDELWNKHRFDIVVNGNLAKFSQHEPLKAFLLQTKKRVLVEASPYDRIWGVGLSVDNEQIKKPQQWRGENLLGFALMAVRKKLETD